MRKKNIPLISILCLLVFAGFSCGSNKGSTDAGVFITEDDGETWEQKVTIDDKNSIASVSVADVVLDRADINKVIIGTLGNGVYLSTDAGETWSTTALNFGNIYSITLNPKDNSVVYAAGSFGDVGKIYKSMDAGNNWEEIFSETGTGTSVNSIVVDWFDPTKVYAGTSQGAIIKSKDRGKSWVAVKWFDNDISELVMNTKDSRLIYIVAGDELYKTSDGAQKFSSINEPLEKFDIKDDIHDLLMHPTYPDTLLLSSESGLFVTVNGGKKWTQINLLTLPSGDTEAKLAFDADEPEKIYIAYDNNFYKSEDGGENWSVKQFTTSEVGDIEVYTKKNKKNKLYVGVILKN